MLLLFFAFFVSGLYSKDFVKTKVISIGYFKKIYGHVHKNPFRYSLGLTTITCGHPLKILKVKVQKKGEYQDTFSKNWKYVKVGPYHGYIRGDYISKKRPSCVQDKYPKFFEKMNLEISDMYYWGKLYDQYLIGKSKVQ